ncbi:NAD kinase [Flavobacterium urocaniciphilum]|uniref:NAD kinase n=1 Tax=Flavobacterium urocaniciphilum TaxID=1299341 RepID=A0A1H9CHR0_9FLAO|nr:NAD kinase [Flavobacterium urocaniciphilum]SEQ00712.1 NAD+ kinase [Flavobacterium urocaniciphilum]
MKIAIFGQYYQNNTHSIVEKVVAFLEQKNIEICFYSIFYDKLIENNIDLHRFKKFDTHECLKENFNFLISIGGDGTILRAATFVRDSNIPIIGINAGRLGFLATVQEENIEKLLHRVLVNDFSISKRTLVSLNSHPENKDLEDINFALNEITVSRKDTTSMITIETFANNEYLNSYWADGLIISTPTGSTGYSLSCGGPVIMPTANCLIITPIAPHNLTARPLVIPDDLEITLKVTGREEQYLVSLDSRITSVSNETTLTIKKTNFHILIVEFPEEGFLRTIRKKLLWGEDKRN